MNKKDYPQFHQCNIYLAFLFTFNKKILNHKNMLLHHECSKKRKERKKELRKTGDLADKHRTEGAVV